MLQDYLKSAVHKSLTKPLTNGSENENQTAACKSQTKSKTSISNQRKNLFEDSLLVMLSDLQAKNTVEGIMSSKRFAFQEPRFSLDGPRLKFIQDGFCASERMSYTRLGCQEPRRSLDGSSRNSIQLKKRSEFVGEEETGIEERMSSIRNRFQKSRFSFDGSSTKFKQNTRFVEEETGVKEKVESKRFSVGGSSRDSIEELRRAIKDSLCRQNLLSRSPENERASVGKSLSCYSARRSDTEEQLSAFKKAKGPNLVAKLMGLEEVPSQKVLSMKNEDYRESLNLPRPNFDIEMPTSKTFQSVEKRKSSPMQKSLDEIIEAMHLKGLLQSYQWDEKKSEDNRRNLDMEDDESPPIVIMKPLYLPQWMVGDVPKNLLLDKSSKNKEIQEEKICDRRRIMSETKDRKEAQRIQKTKMDLSDVPHKPQRKEAFRTRKNGSARQKPLIDVATEEERKDVKTRRMLKSQSNTTCTFPSKSQRRPSTQRNRDFSVLNPETKNSDKSIKEKKTVRANSDGKSTDIRTNNNNHKDDGASNLIFESDLFSKCSGLPIDRIPQEKEKEAEEFKKAITDDGRKNEKPFHEELPISSQAAENTELAKEVVIHALDEKPATGKAPLADDDLMHILLSSRSFITRAQELFKIDARQRLHYLNKGIEEDTMRNAKLYLDCAKELMSRKSDKHELLICPISQTKMLYQLAEEVSSKMKTLMSYIKVDRHDIKSEDFLYVRLERDLRCKDMMMNAMWDVGWICWGFPEEANEVVCEIEHSILSWLIEEVAVELV